MRGSLDFAGGTAVHITAGSSVLAHGVFYVWVLPRIEALLGLKFGASSNESQNGTLPQNGQATTNPVVSASSTSNAGAIAATNGAPASHHDTHRPPPTEAGAIGQTNVILGSLFLWLGWFGFNGGSALGANLRAVSACMCTHLAACSGGVTFCLMSAVVEYVWPEADAETADQNNTRRRPSRRAYKPIKFSIVDFCNGAIIGLVCVTPAAGFIPHQVAPVFGIVGAIVCFGAMQTPLSDIVADMHYIFIVHGVGGLVGMILTGFLARGQVSALDGISSVDRNKGGWDGRWIQIGFVNPVCICRDLLLIWIQETIHGRVCRSCICFCDDHGNSGFPRAVDVSRKERPPQDCRWT
jgi:ammonia channel protein AmtB